MQSNAPETDRLDLTQWLQPLAVSWRSIAAVTLLGVVVGLSVSFAVRRRFEAHATLLVRQLRLDGGDSTQAVNTAGYPALLANRGIAAAVVEHLSLDTRFGETVERLMQRMRVDDLRTAAVLRVVCEFPDPTVAAAIANDWAERAVQLNRDINQAATAASRDMVRAQLQQAEQRLRAAQDAVLAHRRRAQPEMADADVQGLLKKRAEELQLVVDIANMRGRLSAAEAQSARQPPVLDAPRDRFLETDLTRFSSDAATVRAQEYPAGASAMANPVRLLLDYEAARSRTNLEGLEQQLQTLRSRRVLSDQPSELLQRLYEAQTTLKRLELDAEVAGAAYKVLSERFEEAQLRVASMSGDLQVVDRATVPSRAAWPNRPLFALAGGLAAGLLACAWTLRPAGDDPARRA